MGQRRLLQLLTDDRPMWHQSLGREGYQGNKRSWRRTQREPPIGETGLSLVASPRLHRAVLALEVKTRKAGKQ